MPRARVLVADTEQALPLVSRLLGGDGFELCTASSSEAALQCIERQRPHVVIVGYDFDGMRAYRFVQQVRALDNAEHRGLLLVRAAPVLAHALKEKDMEESYRQLGVDEYLVLDKGARGEAFEQTAERLRSAVTSLYERLAHARHRRDRRTVARGDRRGYGDRVFRDS